MVAFAVAGCGGTTTPSPGSQDTGATPSAPTGGPTVGPSTPDGPTATPVSLPTATPTDLGSSPSPSGAATQCSGSDANLAFFAQAAGAMSWSVYCAVVPTGWYLESGSFRLANGGALDVTYRGPGDIYLAISEGNICAGVTDVDVCAPRDNVISPAAMGDRTGVLGRLANGLVLDIERGANPSWRVTGLGLTEAEFVALCAAMVIAGG